MTRTPARKLVYWALRAKGPCPDSVLEGFLWNGWKRKGSTVRGARKALERSGAVVCVGRKGRRRVWDLAGVVRRARVGQQQLF